jgi:hypothetical protein
MRASRRVLMPVWPALFLAVNLVVVGCSNSKKVDEPEIAGHTHVHAKEKEPDDPPRNHGDEKPDEGARRDGEDPKRPIVAQPLEKSPGKEIVMQEFKTPQGLIVKLNVDHDPWADAVFSYQRGKPAPKKNDNPWHAMGKPKGHSVALGHGGTLVVQFIDNVLVNGPGDDLVIFEAGKAIEPTGIAISENGTDWIHVSRAKGSKSTIDIGPYVKPGQRFRYVRLHDAKSGKSVGSAYPGADINAVGALNSQPVADAPSRKEIESKWKKQ